MSSENVSNDMGQKTVMFDLVDTSLIIEGVGADAFSIDCSDPKLSLKQLYSAVFEEVKEPMMIKVDASAAVNSDPKARACFTSVKKVIDSASAEINEKLPDVIAKRKMLEKSLAESAS